MIIDNKKWLVKCIIVGLFGSTVFSIYSFNAIRYGLFPNLMIWPGIAVLGFCLWKIINTIKRKQSGWLNISIWGVLFLIALIFHIYQIAISWFVF